MATTQQYSLRWNNYFRHLTYSLDNHRAENDFIDVTLICDGRKIKAHKVVLSACSAYFKEIFKENPHPHPVIIFKFIKFDDLNAIVEFMYQGEVNVQQEALQSFLQTAELLAVQGLTAEDKEKPKQSLPMIDEQKIIKTIPSTIRPINEVPSVSQTATQTIEIPGTTLIQAQPNPHHVQPQIQHLQVQQQHHLPQTIQVQTTPTLTQTPNPTNSQQIQTVTTNAVTLPTNNTVKKRKITFSDDDENLYTAETVDEQAMVKTADMSFLRGTVKMDLPEYIVSDVDDHLSEDATPQHSQDGSATSGQNVGQFTSEYEILGDQEMEEKYNQSDADAGDMAMEMVGRLLNQSGGGQNVNNSGSHDNLDDDANRNQGLTVKVDNKGTGNPADLLSNKWTECQFCKMIITTVNLWRHIRTQHTPQPPRKCELCNKNFKNKYSLREHIRISHEQKIGCKPEN